MTLLVTLEAADSGHVSLDSLVTVSAAAAAVGGTTAGLKALETLSLLDLLYGLMLPSGNDAATAIAEYVGDRLPASDEPLRVFG